MARGILLQTHVGGAIGVRDLRRALARGRRVSSDLDVPAPEGLPADGRDRFR